MSVRNNGFCRATGKRKYGTKHGAVTGARQREDRGPGRTWTARPCDSCGHWHAVRVRPR